MVNDRGKPDSYLILIRVVTSTFWAAKHSPNWSRPIMLSSLKVSVTLWLPSSTKQGEDTRIPRSLHPRSNFHYQKYPEDAKERLPSTTSTLVMGRETSELLHIPKWRLNQHKCGPILKMPPPLQFNGPLFKLCWEHCGPIIKKQGQEGPWLILMLYPNYAPTEQNIYGTMNLNQEIL